MLVTGGQELGMTEEEFAVRRITDVLYMYGLSRGVTVLLACLCPCFDCVSVAGESEGVSKFVNADVRTRLPGGSLLLCLDLVYVCLVGALFGRRAHFIGGTCVKTKTGKKGCWTRNVIS